MKKKKIIIGTRGSKLALWQAGFVKAELNRLYPDIEIELNKIKTTGDKILDVPLAQVGGKGLFVKEIEEALLGGKADIAVHSMKDVPTEFPEGLHLAVICEREDPRDALISQMQNLKFKIKNFKSLPKGAKIGTSSLRRKAQLLRERPDLECVPIRGNVPTRISQVEKGQFDGTVLAYAGIERLGLAEKVSLCFSPAEFVPAPAQGSIAVQAGKNNEEILKLLAGINDNVSWVTSNAERLVLHKIKAGCHAPAGVFAQIAGVDITIYAFVSDEDGTEFIKRKKQGLVKSAHVVAQDLADELLKAGAAELLKNG